MDALATVRFAFRREDTGEDILVALTAPGLLKLMRLFMDEHPGALERAIEDSWQRGADRMMKTPEDESEHLPPDDEEQEEVPAESPEPEPDKS